MNENIMCNSAVLPVPPHLRQAYYRLLQHRNLTFTSLAFSGTRYATLVYRQPLSHRVSQGKLSEYLARSCLCAVIIPPITLYAYAEMLSTTVVQPPSIFEMYYNIKSPVDTTQHKNEFSSDDEAMKSASYVCFVNRKRPDVAWRDRV